MWYNSLIQSLNITSTGTVAERLGAALPEMVQKIPFEHSSLDTAVSEDVCTWFDEVFNPWFSGLSNALSVRDSLEDLSSEGYTHEVNKVLKALWVARSFYASRANGGFITTLSTVERFKSLICEELANAVATAYESALAEYGEFEGKTTTDTIASEYRGRAPEPFKWTGTVAVYHTYFERIRMVGYAARENNQENPGPVDPVNPVKPAKQLKLNIKKEHVPWMVAGTFGLIALLKK